VSNVLSEDAPTNTPYSPVAGFQRLSTSLNVLRTLGSKPAVRLIKNAKLRRSRDTTDSLGYRNVNLRSN
jgi:hypothetical protein